MFFLLLLLNLNNYETRVDTIRFELNPGEIISLEKTLNINDVDSFGLPLWLGRDFKEKLDELERMPVVLPGVSQIGIRMLNDSEFEYIYLKDSSLFSLKGSEKKLIARDVQSFNLIKNKIVYSDCLGNVFNQKGDKIGSFSPPVWIGGGDEIGIRDGNGYLYTHSGFPFKGFKRLREEEGIPFTLKGIKFFFEDGKCTPLGGSILISTIPVVSSIRNKELDIAWCDDNGRIWWIPWNGNGWDLIDTNYPETSFPSAKIAPSLFFFSPDSFIAIPSTGEILVFTRSKDDWEFRPLSKESYPFATILSSEETWYIGLKGGAVYQIASENFEKIELVDSVSSYASIAHFNGKIIVADGKGRIKGFKENILLTAPVRITSGDLNGDKKDDLVVGNGNGRVHLFLSPEYKDDSLSFPLLGEFLSPCIIDYDEDGREDIILSDIDGRLYLFKNKKGRFEEISNWNFKPLPRIDSKEEYYSHYLPSGLPFTEEDLTTNKILCDFLKEIPDKYKDEVVFVMSHLPTEVLRAMIRLGDINLLKKNAEDIYRAAGLLPYVEILEEEGYTTLLYEKKYKLPMDVYYYYVVHPRILYEIPSKVDVSYWKKDWKFYGMEYEDWLQKEIDMYAGRDKEFWRDVFFTDSLFGKTVFDAVSEATTLREAVLRLYRFQSWAYEGNRMKFGYKTADIQPLQIYYKSYGSCGEQSILFSALLRTVLIPSYTVVTRGEDHQWNHFWYPGEWKEGEIKFNNWHHLDINGKVEDHIATPSASAEGLRKHVSSVVGWQPDGFLFPVTECGYTETGGLELLVVDREKRPVDGALVIIRSGWRKRDMISIWDYTNSEGIAHFDLGYQPLGYTIDVLSKYGMGGKNLFWMKEDEKKRIEIQLSGSSLSGTGLSGFNKEPLLSGSTPELPDSIDVRIKGGFLDIFNFITGSPYRIKSSFLKDSIRYAGTGIEKYPVRDGKVCIEKKNDTIYFFNPLQNTITDIELLVTHRCPNEPPKIGVELEKLTLHSGERTSFNIEVMDNLGVKTLTKEFNGAKRSLSPNQSTITLDVGEGGPICPGKYKLVFIAEDFSGNKTDKKIDVDILPTYSFYNQWIYQDPSPDSLPKGSWVYGPLSLEEDIPFIFFITNSKEKDLDIDLYVYRDKDDNGYPTSNERVGSSSGPTDREKVFLKKPDKGIYWVYVNGCTVLGDSANFDFHTSFTVDSLGSIKP